MKIVRVAGGTAEIELTRRNLLFLLRQLDRDQERRTIAFGCEAGYALVRAVEDKEHYSDRPAGPMVDPDSLEVY